MAQPRPMPGEIYRHFEGGQYQIVTIAKHSETGEELVVYQALYGDFCTYAEPLATFAAEADHGKCPNAAQAFRFERIRAWWDREATALPKTEKEEIVEKGLTEVPDRMSEDGFVHPKLMQFLEADGLEERYNILVSMCDVITDGMIDTMAVVMDTVIPEGELIKRYDDLKNVIRTRQQYELSNRLR